MSQLSAPVIIVGAGPVGLGCALELARFAVRSVLIEKHASTSWHPKTRNFNTRTMEILRGQGLPTYQRLRSIDTPPGWKSRLVGDAGLDDGGTFAAAYGITEHGAVLVRPDGHVGWRSAGAARTGTEITDALRQLLAAAGAPARRRKSPQSGAT